MSTQSAGTFAKLLLAVSVGPEEIGERLKAARRTKGWTQLELALEANVSPATIQRWESGKLPRVRRLMEIADLLGIPADELVEPSVPTERDAETHAQLDRIERLLETLVARDDQGADESTHRAG